MNDLFLKRNLNGLTKENVIDECLGLLKELRDAADQIEFWKDQFKAEYNKRQRLIETSRTKRNNVRQRKFTLVSTTYVD